MENLKCSICGGELMFKKVRDVDIANGSIWIDEIWECSDCNNEDFIEHYGSLTKSKNMGKVK